MAYWLLKTEPSDYAWAQLEQTGQTTWDGVGNAQALNNMRAMAVGDELLIYHSGSERAVVGTAKVIKSAYPDPQSDDAKRVVVDIAPVRALPQPVTLAQIKAEPQLSDWALVRQSRLSVVPCTLAQWQWVLQQAEQH